MVNDIEQPMLPNPNKSELNKYSAQRTLLANMVAHVAVFFFTSFLVYTSVPGSSELFAIFFETD